MFDCSIVVITMVEQSSNMFCRRKVKKKKTEKFKKMKDHGADACFSKPFPLPQLKEEVARLLGLR